jgi:hypothetical protein
LLARIPPVFKVLKLNTLECRCLQINSHCYCVSQFEWNKRQNIFLNVISIFSIIVKVPKVHITTRVHTKQS